MRADIARVLHSSYDEAMHRVEPSAEFVRERWMRSFDVAVVAGSGIDQSLRRWQVVDRIPYAHIPGFTASTVQGHPGELVWMRHEQRDVLVFLGRRHRYEGCSIGEVIANPLLSHALQCRSFMLSNAAGGMNPSMRTGDVMLVRDMINATGRSVRVAQSTRRPLLDEEYGATIEREVRLRSKDASRWMHSGTYVSVQGPSYETRAEVRMYSMIADAIGMSSVLEAQASVQLGMRTACVSVITNSLTMPAHARQKLTHEEVVSAATSSKERMEIVLSSAVRSGVSGT